MWVRVTPFACSLLPPAFQDGCSALSLPFLPCISFLVFFLKTQESSTPLKVLRLCLIFLWFLIKLLFYCFCYRWCYFCYYSNTINNIYIASLLPILGSEQRWKKLHIKGFPLIFMKTFSCDLLFNAKYTFLDRLLIIDVNGYQSFLLINNP
jgi:phosphoglycerol transferase MdoB-like AlkP superfamily enzyme